MTDQEMQNFAVSLAQSRDPTAALAQYHAGQQPEEPPPLVPIQQPLPPGAVMLPGGGVKLPMEYGAGNALDEQTKDYSIDQPAPSLANQRAGMPQQPNAPMITPARPQGYGGYGGPNPLMEAYNTAQQTSKDMATQGKSDIAKTLENFNAEDIANRARSDIQQKVASEYQPILEGHLQAQQAAALNEQSRLKSIQDNMSAREKEVSDARNDYLSRKIDPNGFWKDEKGDTNLSKSVFGALMIGLGEFGSRLPAHMGGGGKNTAMELINDAINRNIDAQKANMEQKKIGYSMANDAYSLAAQKYAREPDRYNFAKLLSLDQIQAQKDEIANKFSGPIAAANNQVMDAQLQQARSDILGKLHHSHFIDANAAANTAIQAAGQVSNAQIQQGHLGIAGQELELHRQALEQKREGKQPVAPIEGTYATRPQTEKERDKVADVMAHRNMFIRAAQDIIDERKKGGKLITPAWLGERLKTMKEQAAFIHGYTGKQAMKQAEQNKELDFDPGSLLEPRSAFGVGNSVDEKLIRAIQDAEGTTSAAIESHGAKLMGQQAGNYFK